jgi:hypothetical protein
MTDEKRAGRVYLNKKPLRRTAMRKFGCAAVAVLLLSGCVAPGAPVQPQAAAYYPGAPYYPPAAPAQFSHYYVPGGGPGYGTTPPGPAPGIWQMPAVGSNYAPNGSTGWAPYSQDYMNEVVKDGANGGAGGGGGRQ